MKEYDNRRTARLFVNKYKKEANHPDYKGVLTDANNKEFEVALWKKTGPKGLYLSLAWKDFDPEYAAKRAANKAATGRASVSPQQDEEDDL